MCACDVLSHHVHLNLPLAKELLCLHSHAFPWLTAFVAAENIK